MMNSGLFTPVSRIAVLRGGGIGDLIMSMPAINALAAAYPAAEITLLGMPWHAEILRNRHTCISRVEILPVAEGIRDGTPDHAGLHRFIRSMRAQKFDLAVQLHGGGRYSNPFTVQLQAAHTVGSLAADAQPLERTVHHQYFQHEVLRALEVVGLAGATGTSGRLCWQATDQEREDARAVLSGQAPQQALVLIHPGARDPRRRWPAGKFATVAVELVRSGCHVVVVGDDEESDLVTEVVHLGCESLKTPAERLQLRSMSGALELGALCGLLSHSSVLVANDSGPRHVAEALGVPTASIYWAPNMVNAGPLWRAQHRVQIAWDTRCPQCGSNTAGHTTPTCGHEGSFVASVTAEDVLEDVFSLLKAGSGSDPG